MAKVWEQVEEISEDEVLTALKKMKEAKVVDRTTHQPKFGNVWAS